MEKTRFYPKIRFSQAEHYLRSDSLNPRMIENFKVYNLVRELTSRFYLSSQDKYEKKWEDFYLPLKRRGKEVSLPFGIVEYKKDFFCSFPQWGVLHIKQGNKNAESFFEELLQETMRFSGLIAQIEESTLAKTVPYDFRTGRLLGKYILDKIISRKEKIDTMESYRDYSQKDFKIRGCSLNDYLKTASICYGAAFKERASDLKPVKMYRSWADKRDGGMLSIDNWSSKKEFANWYESKRWEGSHPFEIVFSWQGHGIHLYPPLSSSPKYLLRVTNYSYAGYFVRMAKALIKNKIPFIAQDIEKVLSYLAGKTFFTVNTYSDNSFFYTPSRDYKKKYFKHIEWDELKILKPKIISLREIP